MAMSSKSTIAKGRIGASTPARRCASPASSTCSPIRTGRRWPTTTTPTRTMSRRKRARPFARSTTTRSCSTDSRSRWCWPRIGRPRASPPRWCGSNTKKSRTSRICMRSASKAFVVEKPEKPRGDAEKAFAAADVRHEAEYFIPTEHHNPMELFASTAIWERRQAHGLRQDAGRAERAAISLRRVRHAAGRCARHVALYGRRLRRRPAPAIPGRAGGAGRARAASARCALVLTRAADVCARLSAGDHRTARARRQGRRHARRDHARGDRRDLAIRGILPQRYRLGRPALQVPQREIRAQARRGSTCRPPPTCARRAPRPASMRSNARWTSSPSRSRSIRSSCGCNAIPTATRTTDLPYTSKQLRECYRQGAAAFGWDKRNPEPRSMRDGSELVGWGMATGVWEALQMPAAVRIVLTANGHAEVATARPPTSAPAPTRSWRRSRPTCSACRSTISASSSAIRRCRNVRSRADRGSRPRCAMRLRIRPARFAGTC